MRGGCYISRRNSDILAVDMRRWFQGSTGCHARVRYRRLRSLRDCVSHYILNFRNKAAEELECYKDIPTFREAINRASTARTSEDKRHPHQRRIPGFVLRKWCQKPINKRRALKSAKNFDQLFRNVEKVGNGIDGIGSLTIYDTAHRIGASRGVLPRKVYLHAGARVGARTLELNWEKDALKISELPKAFWRLKPYEIEDCLCIYERAFVSARKRRWRN